MLAALIANLLLARATARGHEWSVRLALGASVSRLARQLLVESLLLAAMGAAAAVFVARWESAFLVAQLASEAVYLELPLDCRAQQTVGEIIVQCSPSDEFRNCVRTVSCVPKICTRVTVHISSRPTAECPRG